MIKKLRNKIFAIMFASLSIVVLGIIIVFAFLNCNSTLQTAKTNIDRVTRMKERPGIQEEKIKPEIEEFVKEQNEKANSHVKTVIISSVAISGLSLIIIYSISKNVCNKRKERKRKNDIAIINNRSWKMYRRTNFLWSKRFEKNEFR